MAFKLSLSETFSAQVEINNPDEKGRIQKDFVKATYKRLNEDELDAIRTKDNRDVMREVLVDISGLLDDQNQPVPWNDATKEALLSISPASFALAAKFWVLSRAGREK